MKSNAFFSILSLALIFLFIGCAEEKEPIAVTGVTLSQAAIEMTEGDTQTLFATIQPSNAENKSVSWTSNNSSVASVKDGVVTANKAGNAIITVKTADAGKTAICAVIVTAKVIAITSVSLDKTSVELTEGDETTLTATITPENATNKNITWTSSDENIVTVDNGKVTAIKEGTATIAVTTEDGNKSATCEVIVLHDQSNDAIVFADEIMKEMCVNAFDTNGNGELSYKEAEAITDLSKMVLSNKTFKSFDEFQYFISVRDIPDNYFRESNLKSITLPSSIISIGEGAFLYCSSLTSIILPDGVISIGKRAFQGCYNLKSVNIPSGVTNIGSYAFFYCHSLEYINIPDGVTNIENYAFNGCTNLVSIILPDGVTSIGNMAFTNCTRLEGINIPDGVISISPQAFAGCSSLESINIPDGVTKIEYSVFQGCSRLTSIVLPDGVTSIGNRAFLSCSSLESVYVKSLDCPEFELNSFFTYQTFYGNVNGRKIYVPYKSLEAYKTAEGWSEYAEDIVGYDYENDRVVE